jgi:hypothetical protein
MKLFLNPRKTLSVFLWLISLHSFFVGTGLLVLPGSLIHELGFNFYPDNFFRYQGGVFHLVMSFAYAMGAFNSEKYFGLIILTLFAKLGASIFLFVYFFIIDRVFVVFLSGAGDFIMGTAVLYLIYHVKNQKILFHKKK